MTFGKGKQAKLQFERFRGSLTKYGMLEKARDLIALRHLSSSSLERKSATTTIARVL